MSKFNLLKRSMITQKLQYFRLHFLSPDEVGNREGEVARSDGEGEIKTELPSRVLRR
jgi:hypothetical protein